MASHLHHRKKKATEDDIATPAAAQLRAILSSDVFARSDPKALRALGVSITAMTAAMWLLYVMPWYLLPLGWLLAAVCALGLFAIANDCSRGLYFTSSQWNEVVGTACFLPMLLPLESWRLHKKWNITKDASSAMTHKALSPVYIIADFVRGVVAYFDLSQFDGSQINQARVSVALVYVFAATFFTAMLWFGGVWALVKYWLAPFVVFHCGVRLLRTVSPYHYDKARGLTLAYLRLPPVFEQLCHCVNFQVPNSLFANGVPCYNLSQVRAAIAASSEWRERLLSTPLIRTLFDSATAWMSFLGASAKAGIEGMVPSSSSSSSSSAAASLSSWSPRDVLVGVGAFVQFVRTEVNWIHTPLLLGTPLIALYGLLFVTPTPATLVFAVVYYFITGVGITGGYHRLWAHRAYDATWATRFFLLCAASGAVEGSARWWCRDHRAHHRYTDTDKDPYSITKGFFYAHMGWMLLKQKPDQIGRADISDLNSDAMIRVQHKYYLFFALFFGFVLPTLVCGLGWGDWSGGYFYAAVLRLVFVHHATFCVNSLAHYVGSHTYADNHTPRDHFFTALVTLGEGYHNFHHEFPQDYRNAIRWYQYDPTKLFIRLLAFFGLAFNLHRFPQNEIYKGALQIAEKQLAKRRRLIDWGPAIASVPVMTLVDVALDKQRALTVIDGLVYDVTAFVPTHPGGKIIEAYRGKDATAAFGGGVYAHSRAARNLLHTMLVGRLPNVNVDESLGEREQAADDKAVINTVIEASDDHGLLAHVSVARPQLAPIKETAYELDYPLETAK